VAAAGQRVARGLLLNEYRRTARRRVAERRAGDPAATAADPADQVGDTDHVVRALAALREPDRELLMLVGWEGLTVAEAATVLRTSAAVLSVRLHRARRRLARRLAETDSAGPVPAMSARDNHVRRA